MKRILFCLHVDEIPVDRLVGPAVVVDVSVACAADRDHQVTRSELVGPPRSPCP